MDGPIEETNLETIIQALENIELNNLSKDERIQEWLDNITNEEFQLVDSLINLFMDNIRDTKTTNNIMKVLRRNVLPQLRANKQFPKAIAEYTTVTDNNTLSGDAFFLISDIFQSSTFKEVINEQFIKSLFNGLAVITDEDNFNSIVKILTQINYELSVLECKKPLQNTFVSIFLLHENSRILMESLIRIFNLEEKNKEVIYKVLQCLIDVFDASSECVIYSSDLESFINVSISKLESTYTEELRFYILTTLEKLLKYDEYYKSKYKINELTDILESYIDHEGVDEKNKELCKKILSKIQMHS